MQSFELRYERCLRSGTDFASACESLNNDVAAAIASATFVKRSESSFNGQSAPVGLVQKRIRAEKPLRDGD
jgi:hypothetical protein